MFQKLSLFILFLFSTQLFAKNIVIIGDSHGAKPEGWVNQLKKLDKNDSIFNLSISGNTIGFNNLDRDTLNTLRNIQSYFNRIDKKFDHIDMIILLLGTNDCKSVFNGREKEVEQNLDSLLCIVSNHFDIKNLPYLVYVSPPPMADDKYLTSKYTGGNERLKKLIKVIKRETKKYHFQYIDIFHPMWKDRNILIADGVHYKEEGYKKIAETILKIINN